MVLKEAYAYQNFLETLMNTASSLLVRTDFMTTTTEIHHKDKSNPDAQEEKIVLPKRYDFCTPAQVINLYVKAFEEKCVLADAIANAKEKSAMDIDTSMECNKLRHRVISCLKTAYNMKASEQKRKSADYRINATSGSQESYYYDTDVVTTIDFDRNDVRGIIKKLQKQADEISTKKDFIEITTEVDYEPVWDITDSFEDIVATFN